MTIENTKPKQATLPIVGVYLLVRCEWTVDNNLPEDDRLYSTACGEEFLFIDGSPKDNGLKFCCYCGKPIKGN